MIVPVTGRSRWGLVLTLVVALSALYLLRYILIPFVAAGALAYVARPVIELLERRLRFPRWVAALIPYIAFLMLLALGCYWTVRVLMPELGEVMRDLGGTLEHFLQTLFGPSINLLGRHTTPHQAASVAVQKLDDLWQGNVNLLIGGAAAAVMGLILTFVVLAMLMFRGPALARGLLWLVPPHLREKCRALAAQIDPMLGSYLRGVFAIVLFAVVSTYAVAGLVFHLRHALLLSLGVGLLELVPVIGPILSFVAFALIVIQQHAVGSIVGFGVFAVALRLGIDQLVAPLVLGRAAKIPALVVIFAFLAGGTVFGILGILLAIPAAATVKIVLTNLYAEGELANEADRR